MWVATAWLAGRLIPSSPWLTSSHVELADVGLDVLLHGEWTARVHAHAVRTRVHRVCYEETQIEINL